MKRTSVPEFLVEAERNLFGQMLMEWTNSIFSEDTGNTRSSVEERCPPCKIAGRAKLFLYYKGAQTSEI